jgi:hypothetical protein
LIDGVRMGLAYSGPLAGTRAPDREWHRRLSLVAGAGYAVVGGGDLSMVTDPATGGAGWLAARFEYGKAGLAKNGISTDAAFAFSVGPTVTLVEGIRIVSLVYKPGIVVRFGRFHMTYGAVLEHRVHAWSRRPDLVPDGGSSQLVPGFEVGLGVAF